MFDLGQQSRQMLVFRWCIYVRLRRPGCRATRAIAIAPNGLRGRLITSTA
jgi:hypothetical protein